MEIVPIHVQDRGTKQALGRIDLPAFCIDHMRMTPAEANAKTMLSHIAKKCQNIQVQKMYIDNRDCSGAISAADLVGKKEVVIEVDCVH